MRKIKRCIACLFTSGQVNMLSKLELFFAVIVLWFICVPLWKNIVVYTLLHNKRVGRVRLRASAKVPTQYLLVNFRKQLQGKCALYMHVWFPQSRLMQAKCCTRKHSQLKLLTIWKLLLPKWNSFRYKWSRYDLQLAILHTSSYLVAHLLRVSLVTFGSFCM